MTEVFIILAILIVFASITGLIIAYLIQRGQHAFNFKTVFLAYFYVVSIISLLAIVMGGATVGKAILSDIFGRDFSYQTSNFAVAEPMPDPAQSTEEAGLITKNAQVIADQNKQHTETLYQDDLLNGVSMLAVGLIFLVTHVLGWRTLDSAPKRQSSFLFRAYIFAQLGLYSLTTLIALPAALSELLRFWLQSSEATSTPPAPGQMVALAILVLPLWLFFVWRTISLAKT